jgi:hypothetical protein
MMLWRMSESPSGLRDPASWLVATIDDQHAIGPEGRCKLLELGTEPRPHPSEAYSKCHEPWRGVESVSGGHSSRHLTSLLTVGIHLRKRWSARRCAADYSHGGVVVRSVRSPHA